MRVCAAECRVICVCFKHFFLDINLIAHKSCRKNYSSLNQVPVLLGGGAIYVLNQVDVSFISFAFKKKNK